MNLAEGDRLLVIYASANRDERFWTDPDTLDVTRSAVSQLGFGSGTHACAGPSLARNEMQALLEALVQRVKTLKLTAEPTRTLNNVIRGFGSTVRVRPV